MEKKIALITGASNGMGKAISLELAGKGYDLILCSRNAKSLVEFENEILSTFPMVRILSIPADLSVETELRKMADQVLEKWAKVDVLINNVGQFLEDSLLTGTDQVLETMLNINFFSAYHLSKIFGVGMMERKMGHIVNIVSVAGKEPVLGAGAYSISKFALLGLSKNLRLELKPYKVGVSAILPGSTLTGSWEGSNVDPNTLISPQDIAQMVVSCLGLSPGADVEEIEIRPMQS